MLLELALPLLIGIVLGVVSFWIDVRNKVKVKWFNAAIAITLIIAALILISLANTFLGFLPKGPPWFFSLGYIIGSYGLASIMVVANEWFGINIMK